MSEHPSAASPIQVSTGRPDIVDQQHRQSSTEKSAEAREDNSGGVARSHEPLSFVAPSDYLRPRGEVKESRAVGGEREGEQMSQSDVEQLEALVSRLLCPCHFASIARLFDQLTMDVYRSSVPYGLS